MGREDYIGTELCYCQTRGKGGKGENRGSGSDRSDRSAGLDGWRWVVVFKWSDYRVVKVNLAFDGFPWSCLTYLSRL